MQAIHLDSRGEQRTVGGGEEEEEERERQKQQDQEANEEIPAECWNVER